MSVFAAGSPSESGPSSSIVFSSSSVVSFSSSPSDRLSSLTCPVDKTIQIINNGKNMLLFSLAQFSVAIDGIVHPKFLFALLSSER